MFAEKALSLVKEVHQGIDTLLPYNVSYIFIMSTKVIYFVIFRQSSYRKFREKLYI